MVYLQQLQLPSGNAEADAMIAEKRTCFGTRYPFKIFPEKQLEYIDFAPITVFYGGNGSGKTTLLNVIADLCGVIRHSEYNKSAFFDRYSRRESNYCRREKPFLV